MGEFIEKVRITTASLATGASETFDITENVQGNGIPKSMLIKAILVTPSAASRFRLRLFAKDAKVTDPTDENFSLVYELGEAEANSSSITQVRDDICYIDEDVAANLLNGEIHGEILNGAAGAQALFVIDILY